jgi:hypothetical protein
MLRPFNAVILMKKDTIYQFSYNLYTKKVLGSSQGLFQNEINQNMVRFKGQEACDTSLISFYLE